MSQFTRCNQQITTMPCAWRAAISLGEQQSNPLQMGVISMHASLIRTNLVVAPSLVFAASNQNTEGYPWLLRLAEPGLLCLLIRRAPVRVVLQGRGMHAVAARVCAHFGPDA